MKFDKYIQQLIPEFETVIIPGFGAFISEYKPAQLNEDSGEMTPPSKSISFNSKIKNNDGLLVGKIVSSEQISNSDALKKIENEREEILYQLDKGEKVLFGKLGSFFLNENREIQFEPSAKENFLLDAYGLEATLLKKEPEKISDKEAIPVISEETTKKGNRAWLWLLMLIPLIAAGILILQKNKKTLPPQVKIEIEPSEPKKQEIPTLDTLPADPIQISRVDSTNMQPDGFIDSSSFINPDPSKFYLVGGSFQNAENAEKYLQKLKKKGFEPFHLGKQGSFFLVGLEIHDNEIEAYGAQYNFLDKYPDSGVWVFIPE